MDVESVSGLGDQCHISMPGGDLRIVPFVMPSRPIRTLVQ